MAQPLPTRPCQFLAARADWASAAVLAAVVALIFATWRDYGITWDETWHITYGDHIYNWFATAGRDTSALCYRRDYLYGGAFDLLGAIARKISPHGTYETMHLFGALLGLLGLAGAWRLGRRLGGPLAGFWSLTLLATTPVYYGHMFNNPKDLPFAVGYVWSLWALVRLAQSLPHVRRRDWAIVAVTLGSAMSVRIAGILTVCYLFAVIAGYAVLRRAQTGALESFAATIGRFWRPVLLVTAGAWLIMLAMWPWALLDPLRRPLMSLGYMSRFTGHKRTMPFAGEAMSTLEPRWDYLLHYFSLKLPIAVLVLVIAAAIGAVLAMRMTPVRRARPCQVLPWAAMALAIAFPPLYAIVVGSVVYDGLRHFLFLVPPLTAVAGVMVVRLGEWMRPRASILAAAVAPIVALGCIVRADKMVELHPHQYVFFNRLGGGLAGAFGRYDTDYYGNSYKEAFARLYDHLWHEDPNAYLDTVYRIKGCIPDFVAEEYLQNNVEWVPRRFKGATNSDFYLGYTRSNCHNRLSFAPVLFTVEREGTILNVVRDLRGGTRGGLHQLPRGTPKASHERQSTP